MKIVSYIRHGLLPMTVAVVTGVFSVVLIAHAATTISTNVATGGTLAVTGASTLTGDVAVGGFATTTGTTGAFATRGSLTVSVTGTAVAGLNFGFCTAQTVTITASTTSMVNCTGATGVVAGDRIFVMATSSLPSTMIVQAASSTTNAEIQISIVNTGFLVTTATGINSFNFWAVR